MVRVVHQRLGVTDHAQHIIPERHSRFIPRDMLLCTPVTGWKRTMPRLNLLPSAAVCAPLCDLALRRIYPTRQGLSDVEEASAGWIFTCGIQTSRVWRRKASASGDPRGRPDLKSRSAGVKRFYLSKGNRISVPQIQRLQSVMTHRRTELGDPLTSGSSRSWIMWGV